MKETPYWSWDKDQKNLYFKCCIAPFACVAFKALGTHPNLRRHKIIHRNYSCEVPASVKSVLIGKWNWKFKDEVKSLEQLGWDEKCPKKEMTNGNLGIWLCPSALKKRQREWKRVCAKINWTNIRVVSISPAWFWFCFPSGLGEDIGGSLMGLAVFFPLWINHSKLQNFWKQGKAENRRSYGSYVASDLTKILGWTALITAIAFQQGPSLG